MRNIQGSIFVLIYTYCISDNCSKYFTIMGVIPARPLKSKFYFVILLSRCITFRNKLVKRNLVISQEIAA